MIDLSVVIPVYNEEENLPELWRELRSVLEEAETQLRDEARTLGRIEETLGRAEELVARAPGPADKAEWERTVAGKDSQLVEMRLELARVKRESDTARLHLEREVSDLRAKLNPEGAATARDMNLSGQLILMPAARPARAGAQQGGGKERPRARSSGATVSTGGHRSGRSPAPLVTAAAIAVDSLAIGTARGRRLDVPARRRPPVGRSP